MWDVLWYLVKATPQHSAATGPQQPATGKAAEPSEDLSAAETQPGHPPQLANRAKRSLSPESEEPSVRPAKKPVFDKTVVPGTPSLSFLCYRALKLFSSSYSGESSLA